MNLPRTCQPLFETMAQAVQHIALLERACASERARAELAEARVGELEALVRRLQRTLFGQSSERTAARDKAKNPSDQSTEAQAKEDDSAKSPTGQGAEEEPATTPAKPMPSMTRAMQKASDEDSTTEERRKKTQELRRKRRDARQKLPVVGSVTDVPPEEKTCRCCNDTFRPLGEGDITFSTEWVPGHFVRRRHIRRRYVCQCGRKIVVASSADRVNDKVTYGPGFHAYTTVCKCADSTPLYRLAKSMRRQGVNIGTSTLGDIFHRVASNLEPIYRLILTDIAKGQHLNADETTIQLQASGKTKRCYMWVFVNDTSVAYLFSTSRSGCIPHELLNGTTGTLQVDGYTGYNKVTLPDGRTRAGCWAHVRRYFYEASSTAPAEADEMMGMILEMYRVEYKAAALKVLKTPDHLELRRTLTRPITERIAAWLTAQKNLDHTPKSLLMRAIQYTENVWPSLVVCLDDVNVYLDNNISERALRQIALGRKNYMFVGSEDAGRSLAVNQTIVASCDMAGVNPQEYLTDVLIRIQTHPSKAIEQLLPKNWAAFKDQLKAVV